MGAKGDNARVDSEQFPLLPDRKCDKPFEVVQQAGEVILLPSGWWHQAYHVSGTIAVASQYVNTANHRRVLCSLLSLHRIDATSCIGGKANTCNHVSKPSDACLRHTQRAVMGSSEGSDSECLRLLNETESSS